MQSKFVYRTARRWLAVLLVLMFSAAACGLPVTGGDATPTAGTPTGAVPPTGSTPGVPATAQPGMTQVVPTAGNPPANPTATSPQPPPPAQGEVLIYMVALEDAGKSGPQIGCGDSLIPVRRNIEATTSPITAALQVLFSVKDQFYGESGLYNALYQSNLSVQSADVDASGRATVTLVGQYRLGGACDTPRFKAQIEETILSIPGVNAAAILINGVPIDQALSAQ